MAEICVNNLVKSFGNVTAVDIPELNINKGDLIGLVGNNGAGKTTLLRLMLDLAKPDKGSVFLKDINPLQSERWKEWTGAYLDDGFLIDFLTPEEFFQFIAMTKEVNEEQLEHQLAGMKDFFRDEILGIKKYIRDFSAGNRQKIGIAAAMIGSPEILLLDEPFNFLDPSGQEELKRILTEYNKQTSATMIVSSHNLQHTVDIGNRIVLMEKGRILNDLDNSDGKAADVLNDYFSH